MLTEMQIKKFQKIYKDRFGIEITDEAAYEKGSSLIQLMRLIYKPMTISEHRKLQKRRDKTK